MVVCAALLLGGGCFLKANQMNLSLLENIEAFTEGGGGEYSDFPPVPNAVNSPSYCTLYLYSTASGQMSTEDEQYVISLGVSYQKVEGLHDKCANKEKNSTCYPYPCRTKY